MRGALATFGAGISEFVSSNVNTSTCFCHSLAVLIKNALLCLLILTESGETVLDWKIKMSVPDRVQIQPLSHECM